MEKIIIWAAVIILGVIMVVFYGKSKHPVKGAIMGMLLGAVFLVAGHFVGDFFGITLELTAFNAIVSLILGIPGVALLILGQILL